MSSLNFIVDSNPIALVLNKFFNWSKLAGDLLNYFGDILFHNPSNRLTQFFFTVGALGITWKIIHGIYSQLSLWKWVPAHNKNRKDVNSQYFKEKYGNCYAVVTGCTQGIGLAYVYQFAKMGLGVVLVARNNQKLQRRILQIKTMVPDFKYQKIIGDLCKLDDIKRICKQLVQLSKKVDIGIVVNNAGHVGSEYKNFISQSQKDIKDVFIINFEAIYYINSVIVPVLRSRQKRSAILNLSSCTGVFLSQGNGSYTSTKKMLDIYSRTMSIQNRDKIDVLSVRPFGVQTPMMQMRKGKFMITPKDCVVSSLADLGKFDTTWTGFMHKVQAAYFQRFSEQARFETYDKLFSYAKK